MPNPINPKIYFHRIQNHLKEYCYDNYGDEYTELDEEKVGKIFMEYKEDFQFHFINEDLKETVKNIEKVIKENIK